MRTAAARVQAAAGRTTGGGFAHGGDRRSAERSSGKLPLDRIERAASSGVGERTQRKLDALARRAPDLLEKVKAGELSAHAAAKEAGIVKERTALDDLKRAWMKATMDERHQFEQWSRRHCG